MKDVSDVPEQINVLVELAHSLKRFADPQSDDSNTFRQYLMRYLDDLITDLKIPVEISLHVKTGEDENRFLMTSYQVYLNDRRCRFQLPGIMDQDIKAKELAISIAKAVYQNRELFITLPLAQKIQRMWSSDNESSNLVKEKFSMNVSGEDFHEFLINLVKRGFSVDRGKEIGINADNIVKGREFPITCFEEVISGVNSLSLKIFFGNKEKVVQSAVFDPAVEDPFLSLQDVLFDELGVLLPEVGILHDESLEGNDFRIQLNDIRLPPASGLNDNEFMINDTTEALSLMNITGRKIKNPENGSLFAVVQNMNSVLDQCKNAGYVIWNPTEFIVLTLIFEIRKNSGSFLTIDLMRFYLDQLNTSYPALIAATQTRFDITTLTGIMRDLLDEQISLLHLRWILESLLAISVTSDNEQITDPDYLSDLVRTSLKRYIINKYLSVNEVYLLDKQIESRILHEEQLNENDRDQLIKGLFEQFGNNSSTFPYPVIMTSFKARKKLRNLIKNEFPFVPVICPQELEPILVIPPEARILIPIANEK